MNCSDVVSWQDLERVVLPVWMLNCSEPDELGIAQYCVAALTYVAKNQCTQQGVWGDLRCLFPWFPCVGVESVWFTYGVIAPVAVALQCCCFLLVDVVLHY